MASSAHERRSSHIPERRGDEQALADTSLHSEFESDVLDKIDAESFLKTLNPRDRQIFELKKQGLTDKEIAEKVGFANHSAVVKRRKQIARQYLQYAERNAE